MISPATSTDKEETPLFEKEAVSRLSFLRSFLEITNFSGPFAFSRFATAVAVIGNGIVYSRFGDDSGAAGALAITVIYAAIGPARSMLTAVGILIGNKHGEITELIKKGQIAEAEVEKRKIGKLANNGLLLGTFLVLPGGAMLIAAGPVMSAIGASSGVVSKLQTHLYIYAAGLLPLYYFSSDLQFLLGIHHKGIPTIANLITPLLGIGIGYPLAFATSLEMQGVAVGLSAASLLMFLGLRTYLRREEYEPYGLFNQFCTKPGKELWDMVKLGSPLGFQAFTEWGNLFGIGLLVGANGKNASISAIAAFQVGSALTQMINSLGHATTVKLSIVYGQLKEALKNREDHIAQIYKADFKTFGTAGIVLGASFSVLAGSFACGFSKPISSFFANPHNVTQAVSDDILITAQAMLITNGIGMMIDSVRLIAGSALSASKDLLFAPLLGLLTMSVLGMPLGGVFSLVLEWGSNWLFITRDVGILLAAIGVAYRWAKTDPVIVAEAELEPATSVSCFGLFKSANTKTESPQITPRI